MPQSTGLWSPNARCWRLHRYQTAVQLACWGQVEFMTPAVITGATDMMGTVASSKLAQQAAGVRGHMHIFDFNLLTSCRCFVSTHTHTHLSVARVHRPRWTPAMLLSLRSSCSFRPSRTRWRRCSSSSQTCRNSWRPCSSRRVARRYALSVLSNKCVVNFLCTAPCS